MRLMIIAAATSLAIVSAGCKQEPTTSDVNASNQLNEMGSANAAGDAGAALGNADFANAIAGGGRFEVESSDLAASKATSADLKALAAIISADHKKAGEDLKAAAGASTPSFTPLASLDAKQKADLEALKAAGSNFDSLYVSQQIAAHQEAIQILSNYAAGGASPQLKDFATKVLPTVQGHLDKLNALPK
jgi:putative membrane protein